MRGSHPRSHLGRRGSEEVARLRRAAAGSGTRGGGAGGQGRRLAEAVEGVVVAERAVGDLFIGEARHGGGRSGGRPVSSKDGD